MDERTSLLKPKLAYWQTATRADDAKRTPNEMPSISCVFKAQSENAKAAYYRRQGTRAILNAMLNALACFEVGVLLTSSVGFLAILRLIPRGPLLAVMAPLWIGHLLAAAWHVRAVVLLHGFLYGRTPSILRQRSIRALSRREKLPFARSFIMISAQLMIIAGLVVAFDVSLFLRLSGAYGPGPSAASVLMPLIILTVLTILNGILCRGTSALKMLMATLVLIQLLLFVTKIDHGVAIQWLAICIPSLVLFGALVILLTFQILLFYLEPVCNASRIFGRVPNDSQLEIARNYLVGLLCLLTVVTLVCEQLDEIGAGNAFGLSGYTVRVMGGRLPTMASALLFIFASVLILWSIYRVACEEAKIYVDYTGEHKPMPLIQTPSGEWDAVEPESHWRAYNMRFLGPESPVTIESVPISIVLEK